MEDVFTSTLFPYVVFPLGSAILGVAVKYVSRNDRYARFRKEDMFIGLELVLTAVLMFVILTTDRAFKLKDVSEQLAAVLQTSPLNSVQAGDLQKSVQDLSDKIDLAGWTILGMFVGLWSISTIVRKWGWVTETEMKPVIGIAMPLAFGILALILVMAGATS